MADQNMRVAYHCAWCGDGFHEVTDMHSMSSQPIYVDREGNQFDTKFCKFMFHGGKREDWQPKTF